METVPHLTVPQMLDSLQDNGCREKVDRARLSKCFCLGCMSMVSACDRGPAFHHPDEGVDVEDCELDQFVHQLQSTRPEPLMLSCTPRSNTTMLPSDDDFLPSKWISVPEAEIILPW
jgi:hypothetical protein